MRTPRRTPDAGAPAQPPTAARGRRAHAGPPADETVPSERPADAEPGASMTSGPRAGGPAPDLPAPGPYGRRDAAPDPDPALARALKPATRVRGRGLRPRTVRAKIVSLLMVPVVSLLALWGFATVTTAQDIARLRLLQSVDTDVRRPVVLAITALQDERRAAVRQAAAPGSGRAAELKDLVGATDAAVARLRLDERHTVGDSGSLPADVSTRVADFVVKAEGLGRLRTAAVDGRADGDQVYDAYTAAITAGFAVGGALSGIEDTGSGAEARVLLELARAGEMLAREDALLGSAHLTGQLDAGRLREFGGAVEARRTLTESAAADLPEPQRTAWRNLTAQPAYRQLETAEERVRAAAPGRRAAQAVTSGEWDAAHTFVRDGITGVTKAARAGAADRYDPFGGGAFSAGGAAVVFGLVAVAASLVISVRIGRGLVVELVSLRNGALEIARRKLPAAMRRLRAGEEIDIQAEAPPGSAPVDEIGQVGEALTTVHRAALSAAVERAELASGISGVFVNLARRSQVLVHRQLNLLDSMERRVDDPNELGDLFRLDHLTTRMRRHAESLIILSGAAPGRAWRMPVPLTNVVRAAVSEIEDYARVELRQLPDAAVVGGAVADLTHLLAELIENAAQFSPPHTKVRVSGEPVGNGYALEIEDRGLGMGKDSLAEANARIAQSEAMDLFDSDRLGLFVVSRLSSRHDIKVHLRTSPYGGTTAVVLLPTDLLQGALPPGRTAAHPSASASASASGSGAASASASASGSGSGAASARVTAASAAEPVARAAGPATGGVPVPGPRPAPVPAVGAADERGPGTPRPPRIPALAAPPEPARPPAGVTALRQRAPRTLPQASPPPATPPAGPADPAAGPAAPRQDTGGDLPRRIRQASLVPQLREAPEPGPYAAPAAPEGAVERTPEQVRDRMSAYRDGWQRGGGRAPGSPLPDSPRSGSPLTGSPLPDSLLTGSPLSGSARAGSSLSERPLSGGPVPGGGVQDTPPGPRRPLGTGHGHEPSDPGSEGDDE
ncbi:nitrate- and nitrite sensing domain-containing protein [Streptomyces sp. NPDC051921]|uniref:sensor histidine kinase n=1 Tax=Streptomyces sp. NPDC051921 TaxID=3155806 RepID=UPI00344432CA